MPQKTKNTPMMEQYLSIKKQYPDAFLFYRLGDFYELFHDDAMKAAKLLEITLTSRNKNADEPIPMCGVPYHAAAEYIRRLVEMGHKVAVCEQMEDAKLTKGMVRREVVRVITPGTFLNENGSENKANNYLASVFRNEAGGYALGYVDIGTGELKVTLLTNEDGVFNELQTLPFKEIVLDAKTAEVLTEKLEKQFGILVSIQEKLIPETDVHDLVGELPQQSEKDVLVLLLSYLSDTQKRSLSHLQKAVAYQTDAFLKMDTYARRNLELSASIRTQQKKGSLLWTLDETKTAMGGRMLKQWLEKPLINLSDILERQRKVESLVNHYFERMDINDALTSVYDLERLVARVSLGNINGRDLIQLKTSLQQIPGLVQAIATIDEPDVWQDVIGKLESYPEIIELIERAITDNPPIQITEGNIIRDGYHEQLDRYRDAMNNGKLWIAMLQKEERLKTGIKTLKIGYNRIFGYYIEVTKANLAALPEGTYERKQTLANAERFVTPALKEKETLILEAEEKSVELEHELFVALREEIKGYSRQLQALAKLVAEIDVLQSFAHVSEAYHFSKPELSNSDRNLSIKEGRHPVVERVIGKDKFVPNSISMDEDNHILLITGPNMSGKSTYMRQVALIVILAQMGCFVPAEKAHLPIFDQIFTRIGAADDLYSGQSTFMVEMVETNQALRFATDKSLILFDEIGRGTATYDGMALAEAILRYINRTIKGKTLFSTHYHELTQLEDDLAGTKNVHVGAIEKDGELVFLHKLMQGPADKSYGLHVAKLAGMPHELIAEAQVILDSLNEQHVLHSGSDLSVPDDTIEQLALFQESAMHPNEKHVLDELSDLALEDCTPMQAMLMLDSWKKLLKSQKSR